jgi:hypothetical protein
MKKLLIAALALVGFGTAQAQKKVSDVAKFDVETFDFGKVKVNVPATATFTITNISNQPILIETVTPACGCTKGDYTTAPIKPGATGKITAIFNAAAVGAIHKTVSIKLNGIDEIKVVNLAGEVLDEAAYAKYQESNKSKGTAEVKTQQPAKSATATKKTKKPATSKKVAATTPKS